MLDINKFDKYTYLSINMKLVFVYIFLMDDAMLVQAY